MFVLKKCHPQKFPSGSSNIAQIGEMSENEFALTTGRIMGLFGEPDNITED